VTPEYIQRVGTNSPGGTLLRWWRAVQLDQEARAVVAYATSVDTHRVPHEIAHLTYYVKRSRPSIIKTRTRDGRARVVTLVNGAQFDQSDPHKVLLLNHTPASFQLVRQSGRWKLADDAYLEQQFRAEFRQG